MSRELKSWKTLALRGVFRTTRIALFSETVELLTQQTLVEAMRRGEFQIVADMAVIALALAHDGTNGAPD